MLWNTPSGSCDGMGMGVADPNFTTGLPSSPWLMWMSGSFSFPSSSSSSSIRDGSLPSIMDGSLPSSTSVFSSASRGNGNWPGCLLGAEDMDGWAWSKLARGVRARMCACLREADMCLL
eukprot:CAMPEP_0113946332 /NCGR_PEP_ID=MMETSP1339-20121228/56621_1 /TAXON_ID=94617 /ORGANISM="Fibrocapsa japonica" /LENGTH=118 /DNA_ID=CAMNT_0000952365 /DNA_START=265 /DNA_END=621 /DNA_ORIENTATION=- /assembly_acc=CAM_ASM_000762